MNIFNHYNKCLFSMLVISLFISGCDDKSNDATEPFQYNPVDDQYKEDAINIGSIAMCLQ